MFRALWAHGVNEAPADPASAPPAVADASADHVAGVVVGGPVVAAAPRNFGRGAGGRGRGRGRAAGYRHSEITRARMRAASANNRAKQAKVDREQAIDILCPTQAEETARHSQQRESGMVLVDGAPALHRHQGHGSERERKLRDRALVSHVQAQSAGLAAFVDGAAGGRAVKHIFATNIFDDASMWIAKPTTSTSAAAGSFEGQVDIWSKSKGKNVHLPVLNLCESLFARADVEPQVQTAPLLGAEVHSPAQVLAQANTPTMRRHWAQWSVLTARGAGRKVASTSSLRDAVRGTPWKTMLCCRDNLVVNDCLMCLEEEEIDAELGVAGGDRDRVVSLISIACCAHSAVLALKPLLQCMDCDVPGNLVRLGHIMESGRTSSLYLKALEDEIGDHFQYRQVLRFPPEAEQWRRKAERILVLSRAAQDLSLDQEKAILNADNCSWDELDITHFCLRHNCPLGCRGCEHRSKRVVTKTIIMSVGGPMTLPLLYRWKGFEKANAWAFRCRAQHDLLLRALRRVFPPSVVAKAENAARLALAGADPDVLHKQNIRGGRVVEFFSKDPGGKKLESACVLNAPLQTFLNGTFKAEAATIAYVDMCYATSVETKEEKPDVTRARRAAMQLNLSVISGSRGSRVVHDMAQVLENFAEGPWAELGLSDNEKYSLSLGMLRGMGDAWHRLVFYYEQPKFAVFSVCDGGGEFDDALIDALIRHHAQPLDARQNTCNHCIDPYFTKPWLRRLLDPRAAVRRLAHTCLCDLLAAMPVCSAKCERKHLLGQEARPRKRGRALQAGTLEKVTYSKAVDQAATKMKNAVIAQSFGTGARAKRRWAQGLAAFRLGRSRKRDVGTGKVKLAAFGRGCRSGAKPVRVRAFDVFVSENFADQPDGLSLGAKRARVIASWRALSAERRAYFEGKAAAESAERERLRGRSLSDFIAEPAAHGLRRQRARTARRQAIAQTFADMQQHPMWSGGAQLACLESGLRASKVLACSDVRIAKELKAIFQFDSHPLPTRKNSMKPFVPCCTRFGGLCATDPLRSPCCVASANLHTLVREKKVQLPVLVKLHVVGADDCAEHHFLTGFKARGSVAVFVKAATRSVVLDGRPVLVARLLLDSNSSPYPNTSQRVFRKILRTSAHQLGVGDAFLNALGVTFFETQRFDEGRGFAVSVISDISSSINLRVKTRGSTQKFQDKSTTLPFGLSLNMADADKVPADIGCDSHSDLSNDGDVLKAKADEALPSESATGTDVEAEERGMWPWLGHSPEGHPPGGHSPGGHPLGGYTPGGHPAAPVGCLEGNPSPMP